MGRSGIPAALGLELSAPVEVRYTGLLLRHGRAS